MSDAPLESEVFSAIFDSLPMGAVLFDLIRDEAGVPVDLRCRLVERTAAHALGVDPEASSGRRVRECLSREDADACLRAARAVLETGGPVEAVLGATTRVRWTKAGVHLFMRTLEVSAAVEGRREAEELAQRLAENIAERESIEAALRQQVRQKDELLAVLGHELRNPLAAIRSASEVLGAVVTEDAKLPRVIQVLERQISHMARLLDDLLDLTRVRSGQLTIEPDLLDLCEVVLEVVSALGPRVREHRFTVDMPPRPLWVRGDRVRLAQVTHSLIENALKYTPPRGEVSVRLGHRDDGAVLTVTDTGVGIEPELRPRLFRPFQQAPQGLARSSGGLGLGLAMSRTIIELHHGTIEARSEGRDRGSELEVWLPLGEPEPASAPGSAPALAGAGARRSAGRVRIMLIEDNEDAAELFATLLRARGHEVYIAGRGREGLKAMEHWRPDAVICDIGLPDMDGYAVARAIRSDPRLASVRLLALSGYGQDEDRRRSVEAGFDVHFTKPTDIEEILARIQAPAPARR